MTDEKEKPAVDPHAALDVEPVGASFACLRFAAIALVVMGLAYACAQTMPPPLGLL